MKWVWLMAWRELRFEWARGLLLLLCMSLTLVVLVAFSSIRAGLRGSFYEIATVLTGGDLRVEVVGAPSERLRHLLPRLGDRREVFWSTVVQQGDWKGRLWFRQVNPVIREGVEGAIVQQLPDRLPMQAWMTDAQRAGLPDTPLIELRPAQGDLVFEMSPERVDAEVLPLWVQRVQPQAASRIEAQCAFLDALIAYGGLEWEQVWVYHVDAAGIQARVLRAQYLMAYLLEEGHGVRLICELPDEIGFFHGFRVIANTLFLAAFAALMLGTMAFTVTFVDFSRSRSQYTAVLRSLGCGVLKAWGIYALQVGLYATAAVAIAGGIAVAIQLILPGMLSDWTGLPMEVGIQWRSLVLTLGFGACFLLIPGLIAIFPMLSCEAVEVLRSVKMPLRRKEHLWAQALLALLLVVLALCFALQMVDDTRFAILFLSGTLMVYFLMVASVHGLRKALRLGCSRLPSFALRQGASNLFRHPKRYAYTLGSIAFGLFLITFLWVFFNGQEAPGERAIEGYRNVMDERVAQYLDWLNQVFWVNQWVGVLLLSLAVLSVLILLTFERPGRVFESVVLATLGASPEQIRHLHLWEAAIGGLVASFAGLVGGWVVSALGFWWFLGVEVRFPFLFLLLTAVVSVASMVLTAWLQLKGVVGFPPLEVLRRRRHFDNW
jgi:predicted lysophospholipase L1 biosynthesis ABC-type transport system permease subunit